MVHHLSLRNAGYRLGYRVPLLEQNDCHFAQSKGIRAGSENRILTDVLEQQGAGPVIREQITSRRVATWAIGFETSALTPGCVKTRLSQGRAELFFSIAFSQETALCTL